jgi:hypothetical protein
MEVGGQIGRVSVSGAITEYAVPSSISVTCGSAYANAITSGPDGALWFICSNYIVRMTTAGAVTFLRPSAEPTAL